MAKAKGFTVRKVNMLTELRRIARDKKPSVPVSHVADWALQWVKYGLDQTEIAQLERMYRLKDPRD
jgi:hypothetical protein